MMKYCSNVEHYKINNRIKDNYNTSSNSYVKKKFSDHFKTKNQLFSIESSFSGNGLMRLQKNGSGSNSNHNSLGGSLSDSPFKNLYCQCAHHMQMKE